MRLDALKGSPLYRLVHIVRVISLAAASLFLLALGALVWALPSTRAMAASVALMAAGWLASAAATLTLHKSAFGAAGGGGGAMPGLRAFRLYYVCDCAVVAAIVFVGRMYGLNLDSLAALLFSHTLTYVGVYFFAGGAESSQGGGRPLLGDASLVFSVLLLGFFMLFGWGRGGGAEEARWFRVAVDAAPPAFAALLAACTILVVAALVRARRHVARKRLDMLGSYGHVLSESLSDSKASYAAAAHGPENQFERRLTRVLEDLCSQGPPFWYNSACLWFHETHQDRGDVLVPGPAVNFDRAGAEKDGVGAPQEFDGLTVVPSVAGQSADGLFELVKVPRGTRAPGALVPVQRSAGGVGGMLTLLGREGEGPLLHDEAPFLRALGSLISGAMEQWEGRYRAAARAEMDDLFDSASLDALWSRAARLIRKYLAAEGCMIIFRPDPAGEQMHIVAKEGFGDEIFKHNVYVVGKGQTGRCAQTGRPIRFDDVARHEAEFDRDLLRGLEKASGRRVRSWMAVPIGPAGRNYGVVKVVNSTSRRPWFGAEDERLGMALALRLHVIIEKFLHVEQVEAAVRQAQAQSEEARRQSEMATLQQKKAEQAAMKRQEDLMIIMHQLQGPLASILGSLYSLSRSEALTPRAEARLNYVEDLVSDALTLCYGIFTSFAIKAGSRLHFDEEDVNAPDELRKLCDRLRMTNARDDITLYFYQEPDFPVLRMDREVFISVFYSLIHNAMKYADEHSQVSLICGVEKGRPALKVKSVGEPVLPGEAESIFQKFRRGSIVERTGRYHRGVGLGLWVARELMRAVGGDVHVELSPEHPRLSVFVVSVPEARARA